jgi:NADH:ubiquinone oxidoreductase subunit 6 (subunit J)
MTLALILIALVMLGSAAVAMSLRNLIHSALLLVLSWAGIAAFYLWAGAEFVAFAQVLVYVGAVSMIVLFAVLLTRRPALRSLGEEGSRADLAVEPASLRRAIGAVLAGALVASVLAGAVLSTRLDVAPAAAPVATVRQLGFELMGPQAAAVLVVGVILTVALIGAVVIASSDRPEKKEDAP